MRWDRSGDDRRAGRSRRLSRRGSAEPDSDRTHHRGRRQLTNAEEPDGTPIGAISDRPAAAEDETANPTLDAIWLERLRIVALQTADVLWTIDKSPYSLARQGRDEIIERAEACRTMWEAMRTIEALRRLRDRLDWLRAHPTAPAEIDAVVLRAFEGLHIDDSRRPLRDRDLPDEAIALKVRIEDGLARLGRMPKDDLDAKDAFDLQQCGERYLPDAIAAYGAVEKNLRNDEAAAEEKTAQESLVAQLTTILARVEAIERRKSDVAARRLSEHERFLALRFGEGEEGKDS